MCTSSLSTMKSGLIFWVRNAAMRDWTSRFHCGSRIGESLEFPKSLQDVRQDVFELLNLQPLLAVVLPLGLDEAHSGRSAALPGKLPGGSPRLCEPPGL